jgi:predicted MFS family arabinose efflux permease
MVSTKFNMKRSETPIAFLILAIGVGLFAGSMGVYLVPVQIGALIDGLGFSASQTGLLGAVEVGAMSITAIAISSKLDRWSRSRTAMYGAIFAAACEILTGFIDTLILLFPLRILVGIGCGLVFGAICAAAASTSNPDRNFGWGQAVMNLLFMIMFILLPYTLSIDLHRGLFVALGIVLLLTVPFYRSLPDVCTDIISQESSGRKANTALIAMLILATVLLNIGLGALWGFVERIGSDNVGLSPEMIGTVLSMSTLFMIGGSLFAAWLGVRIGRAIPMASASVLCALAAMLVTNAETLMIYAGGLFLYNAAYLFLGPYIIAGSASALDPSGRLASAMGGIMFFSYSVGIGAGGFIADIISLAGIGLLALFTCLLAAPLFAIVSMRLELQPS